MLDRLRLLALAVPLVNRLVLVVFTFKVVLAILQAGGAGAPETAISVSTSLSILLLFAKSRLG